MLVADKIKEPTNTHLILYNICNVYAKFDYPHHCDTNIGLSVCPLSNSYSSVNSDLYCGQCSNYSSSQQNIRMNIFKAELRVFLYKLFSAEQWLSLCTFKNKFLYEKP